MSFCKFTYSKIKKIKYPETLGPSVFSRSIPSVGVTCVRPLPYTPSTQHALLYWLTLSDNLSCTYCVPLFQR